MKEIFYLTTHSTHFIYGYMASAREETRCRHYIGYSFPLASRILLYAPPNIHHTSYHDICYASRGSQAGTRNSEEYANLRRLLLNLTTLRNLYDSTVHVETEFVYYSSLVCLANVTCRIECRGQNRFSCDSWLSTSQKHC